MQYNRKSIAEYTDFLEYLQNNLTWYQYENLYRLLHFNSQILLTRLIRGSSITFWEFTNFVELFKLLENAVLPSVLIAKFNLKHRLTQLELDALDNTAAGIRPIPENQEAI